MNTQQDPDASVKASRNEEGETLNSTLDTESPAGRHLEANAVQEPNNNVTVVVYKEEKASLALKLCKASKIPPMSGGIGQTKEEDESVLASIEPIPNANTRASRQSQVGAFAIQTHRRRQVVHDDGAPSSRLSQGSPVIEAHLVGAMEEGLQNDDRDVVVVAEELDGSDKPNAVQPQTPISIRLILVLSLLATVASIVTVVVLMTEKKSSKNGDTAADDSLQTATNDYHLCGTLALGQADYTGMINTTRGGRTCQRWDSQFPHKHVRFPDYNPTANLMENYCRNPDGELGAWCYTTDPDKRWEYCAVDPCPNPPKSFRDIARTTGTTGSVACIDSPFQFHEAMEAYLQDDSGPNSMVAQVYGWPIGTWCFSNELRSLAEGNGKIFDATVVSDVALFFSEDIGSWDVSRIWDFSELFNGAQNLSSHWGLGQWNVSQAIRLDSMFENTHIRDGAPLDLGNWDVSGALSINNLFQRSNVQFANISNWDTSNLKMMTRMAKLATRFNEDISAWDVSSAHDLKASFEGATNFNQDLSEWNTTSTTTMNALFASATSFNQPLGKWDVSNVDEFQKMFRGATSFNRDVSNWNVSGAKNMEEMFSDAISFNQNLCAWGALLSANDGVRVKDMFVNTSCPNQGDPVLSEGGPFCHECPANQ